MMTAMAKFQPLFFLQFADFVKTLLYGLNIDVINLFVYPVGNYYSNSQGKE